MKVLKGQEHEGKGIDKLHFGNSTQPTLNNLQHNLSNALKSQHKPKEADRAKSIKFFSQELYPFLIKYQAELMEDKPWFFTSIWDHRNKQVNQLIGMYAAKDISRNDQRLVEECIIIANEDALYPLRLFNRMDLPLKIRDLLRAFSLGKVNFDWNSIQTNSELTERYQEALSKVETISVELEDEKLQNHQLRQRKIDLENMLDDRAVHVELKQEEFKQVWSSIDSRSKKVSLQRFDTLLIEYKKIEEKNRKYEKRLNELETSYAKVCKELLAQQSQLEDENDEDEMEQIENHLKQKDMIISNMKFQLSYRDKVLKERYQINEALKKKLKSADKQLETTTKQKEEEINQLKQKLSEQERKVQVLGLLVKKLLNEINGQKEVKQSNVSNSPVQEEVKQSETSNSPGL